MAVCPKLSPRRHRESVTTLSSVQAQTRGFRQQYDLGKRMAYDYDLHIGQLSILCHRNFPFKICSKTLSWMLSTSQHSASIISY